MRQTPTGQLSQHDTSLDLKAAVQARRELEPELEDHLLEGFLARIEERVDFGLISVNLLYFIDRWVRFS